MASAGSFYKTLFCIRTITCFVRLPQPKSNKNSKDGDNYDEDHHFRVVSTIVTRAIDFLKRAQTCFTEAGYTVQTIRIATNPFGQWLLSSPLLFPDDNNNNNNMVLAAAEKKLQQLDALLAQHGIDFLSLGPATNIAEVLYVIPRIVQTSKRFSCSATLEQSSNDGSDNTTTNMARACGKTVQTIASPLCEFLKDGLGNFRFAVAACCPPYIPFFPVAKAEDYNAIQGDNDGDDSSDNTTNDDLAFSLGLENGSLAQMLLKKSGSIAKLDSVFREELQTILLPIQALCQSLEETATANSTVAAAAVDEKNPKGDLPVNNGEQEPAYSILFKGIDTSLNPSLGDKGSVARALEFLDEVETFGGPGSLAAASAITNIVQSISGLKSVGYQGLMIPVCEDERLAELTKQGGLSIVNLLSISSVCGVGVDTVPIPGDCTFEQIASLYLDVGALAHKWNKPLSCRVFPCPGKRAGDWTTFDSPYMVNAKVLSLGSNSNH